ncbi:MAG TPA: TolC family protein [Bryobacteraceae bacterium]|nr:TolC family protein [Bryobacteraceae bacterium]
MQSSVSFLCVWLMLFSSLEVHGQTTAASPDRSRAHELISPSGTLSWLTGAYRTVDVPPISLSNSPRLENLLRAGNLYLSLQDAIALALENNLDIEIQRYGPQLADASILRAKAGGFVRGVTTSVTQGPTSAQSGGGSNTTGISTNAATAANAAIPTVGNNVVTQTGSAIPNLDPAITGLMRWGHYTTPQSSAFITGTRAFIQRQDITNFGVTKGFTTGTTVNMGFSTNNTTTNNRSNDFNPSLSTTLGFTLTQRLLQGFGRAVNSRQIEIARNNREVSDLTFKLQVITTVSAVMNLYWDLVGFIENVRVKKQTLAASQKLYEDNKKQVEIGTLAPIEIVRAEAEVATDQQNLTIAETQVLQQETILKNALSRNGVASPAVADAHVIPTDRILIPDVEPISPIQDLMNLALSGRPELAQNRISITNSRINLRGDRSALRPSLDAVVNLNNNALAGQFNTLPVLPGRTRQGDPFYIGGLGLAMRQIFARNFPDYNLALNLNIPIHNRAAQADMINDELTLRQQELQQQRAENQVRVDVQNAVIAVQQARAQFQAATKARILQEQTVDAEQKKYALGASTIYNVILTQRDLATAQQAEVTAEAAYAKAKVELDRATGQTLVKNNISIDEALRGMVSRPHSPIPAPQP